MAKDLSTAKFDYRLVPDEAKGKLIWYASELGKQAKTHVESGLQIGRILSEAKKLIGDGGRETFQEWVDSECGFSKSTAYNYISAWENFGECPTVGHIELGAMYQLAKSSGAKKKALKLADKGVRITQSMAKQFVEEAPSEAVESPATIHENTPEFVNSNSAKKLAPRAQQAIDQKRVEATPSDVERLAEFSEVEQADIVETVEMGDAETVGAAIDSRNGDSETDPAEENALKVKATRRLIQELVARAVRTVDDLHQLDPNSVKRAKVVRLLQDAGGLIW